jgi:oxygen-dependent protoporphyrinogen oxidase
MELGRRAQGARRRRCQCTSLTTSNAEIARNPHAPFGFRSHGGICPRQERRRRDGARNAIPPLILGQTSVTGLSGRESIGALLSLNQEELMDRWDVIVVGGGISGMSFAYASAAAGKSTLVLEKEPRSGGCIDSRHLESGYWFEMGAHTAYNSYGGLIDILQGCGMMDRLLQRAKAPFCLLQGNRICSFMAELNFLELAISLPRGLASRKDGLTVADYYSRLVGPGNYTRVLGPFLSAVPSQTVDAFPSTMLFKKRPRRKNIFRSYTLAGGLSTVIDAIAKRPNMTIKSGVDVASIESFGRGIAVTGADGHCWEAAAAAVATPPSVAALILEKSFPELGRALKRIGTVGVDSVGIVVPASKLKFKSVAGLIPACDLFFSAVSRDTVPDEHCRAFTFHFKPGLAPDARETRIAEVLGVERLEFQAFIEKHTILPSPVLGHGSIVSEIDRLSAGTRLCLIGNYFGGLAIEDCITRSNQEFARLPGQF